MSRPNIEATSERAEFKCRTGDERNKNRDKTDEYFVVKTEMWWKLFGWNFHDSYGSDRCQQLML